MSSVTDIKYNQSLGKKLYLILWCGTFLIGAVLFILGQKEDLSDRKLQKNPAFTEQEFSGKTINDLLLSVDELTITEKKSFINLYLKPGENVDQEIYQKAKEKYKEVYNQILQRKVNKLKNKRSNDFSIRPVPK